MKLTPKQQRFVEEYLIDLNASAALKRAGYKSKNPDVDGHQLLVKPSIQKAVQEAMDARSKRTEITADKVLQELAHIAFDDIKNYLSFRTEVVEGDYDINGEPTKEYRQIIEMRNSDDIDTRNVSEVSFSPKDGFKFKLYDKQKALVDLGRHLKLFTEKVEHSGTITNQNIDLSSLSVEELKKLATLDE